ncbi:DUF397 domain-containing protein [Streptomyces hygroscopicus]|uniref:DUF397 domain-containing protein n=1 Tax=Streptomyces hygroscopicus TaxID=1912 RepID=UPI0036BDF7B9
MSTAPAPHPVEWVKSSYSNGGGGSCVEWAPAFAPTGAVPVRDSKNPNGPALVFPTPSWSSFISAVRNGQLRPA